MDEAFLAAVANALIPGGPLPNDVVAPAAHEVGVTDVLAAHAAILDHIAIMSGGARAFACANTETREQILRRAEQSHPQDFVQLATAALKHYYAHPQVIEAFGWTTAPPQPHGHRLPPFDDALTAKVRARGPIRRSET